MQKKDEMHPQDMRNLVIFGLLSLLLWFSYDHFILKPKLEKINEAKVITQEAVLETQAKNGMGVEVETERPRADIVSEGERVSIKNDLLIGSINLTGVRFDDLLLTKYFKTIKKEENAVIFSPMGSVHPKYVEEGWVSSDKNLKLPSDETKWKLVAGETLSKDKPITLRWNNGQGLVFEQVISLNEDYAFTIVRRVINNSAAAVTLLPYSLIAQRGIPEDFFGRWVVHEGPIGYFDDELIEESYGKMDDNPLIAKTAKKGWVGITAKNWHTALVPDQTSEMKYRVSYTKAAVEGIKDRYQTDMTGPAQVAQAGGMLEFTTHFYAGAKKLALLEKYEDLWGMPHFDLAVDFGWYYFLTRPFFAIINFFYGIVGNFGLAIILFTVVLRICVFPLANTSFKSFAKMRQIGPEMTELRDKYKSDKKGLQQELVKLYQREKVNPMAGCLPIVIQIPIFFSLFKVLSNTIEMRHAPFFGWIEDLSAPDPTSVFNLFGLLSFTPPDLLMIGAWPCFMLVTMIIQRKLSPPPTDKFQAQLIATMPWIMTFVLAKFAVGLVIYWTFNNLLSVIQQYIIMRRMGVEVDIIGNFFGKNKSPTPIDGVHAEAALVEEEIEDALGIDQKDTPENDLKKKAKATKKKISKPKPKKKTPTKKKKKK